MFVWTGSITYSKDEATVRVLNILIKILAYVPLAYVLLLLAYLVWRHCRPPGDGGQGDQDSLTNEDPQSSSDHLEWQSDRYLGELDSRNTLKL